MDRRHHPFENQGSRKAAESKSSCEPPRSCPRCESTNTKFCYYNNYSSSQPRYFCRACRRYWTQGGALRNLPHGSTAAGRAAKYSKRSSSASYPASAASAASVLPLHHQMSGGVTSPGWCFIGDGLLRGVVEPSMVVGIRNAAAQPEMAGGLSLAGREEVERSLGNLFGGFEDGSGGEGGERRMPAASSGPFI